MHLPDGILSGPMTATTLSLAAGGVAIGLARLDAERVPLVGALASVFFVATLLRLPFPPTSVHPILCGMMGCLLGWAAFPAAATALFLQAILFGHGGFLSLGANVINMAVPAVICWYVFGRRLRPETPEARVFLLGFGAGAAGVLLSGSLFALTLFLSGREFWAATGAIAIGHVPLAMIEGYLTASTVVFLHKVRPRLFLSPGNEPIEEASVDA